MKLNELKSQEGARKERTRVGRGIACGKGKTCGRGHKGQKARSGVALNGYEGGQMPLYKRMPKRGFHNIFRKNIAILTLERLQAAIESKKLDSKKPVTEQALLDAKVIRRAGDGVKLLATGELKEKLDIRLTAATKGAQEAVKKAGGKFTQTQASKSTAEESKSKS